MAEVKVNGESTSAKEADKADNPGQSVAKSVISITGSSSTITSTDNRAKTKGGNNRATTTPLRSQPQDAHTSPIVSARLKDAQLVTALTQQFKDTTTLVTPSSRSGPNSSTCSSRASLSRSSSNSSTSALSSSASAPGSSASAPSSNASTTTEELTSKLNSMLIQQQQRRPPQQQRNLQPTDTPQQPPEPVPSRSSLSVSVSQNGCQTSNGGPESGASRPEVPPPPPPSALHRAVSEQPASERKQPDAAYSPRTKSYSAQNSVSHGNGNGNVPPHNKNDLMASLTAVVSSGSAVSGLRKTRGPGRSGGVTEVFSSKKSSSGSKSAGNGAT